MKVHIVLFLCLVYVLSVYGQTQVWTGLKCGMDNQKLYDRSYYNDYGIDTCAQYCSHAMPGTGQFGSCQINNGYGECRCGYFWLSYRRYLNY